MTTTTNFYSARVFSSIQLIGWNRLLPLSNSNFFKANALKINTNAFKIIHSKSFISKSFIQSFKGSKGWRSSEGICLPPMWPGFNSRRWRHMWVEFVVGSLPCSKRFFSGFFGFPLSSKNQHFQIPIQSGTHGGASWVNKQFTILHFFLLFS